MQSLRNSGECKCSPDGKESACIAENQVPPLGGEEPLENEIATHSSIPAWRIPWMEDPGGLWGHIELDMTE